MNNVLEGLRGGGVNPTNPAPLPLGWFIEIRVTFFHTTSNMNLCYINTLYICTVFKMKRPNEQLLSKVNTGGYKTYIPNTFSIAAPVRSIL